MSAGFSVVLLAYFHQGSAAVPSKVPFVIRLVLVPGAPALELMPPAAGPPLWPADPPFDVPPLPAPALAEPAELVAPPPPEVPPPPALCAPAGGVQKHRAKIEENVASLSADEGTTIKNTFGWATRATFSYNAKQNRPTRAARNADRPPRGPGPPDRTAGIMWGAKNLAELPTCVPSVCRGIRSLVSQTATGVCLSINTCASRLPRLLAGRHSESVGLATTRARSAEEAVPLLRRHGVHAAHAVSHWHVQPSELRHRGGLVRRLHCLGVLGRPVRDLLCVSRLERARVPVRPLRGATRTSRHLAGRRHRATFRALAPRTPALSGGWSRWPVPTASGALSRPAQSGDRARSTRGARATPTHQRTRVRSPEKRAALARLVTAVFPDD